MEITFCDCKPRSNDNNVGAYQKINGEIINYIIKDLSTHSLDFSIYKERTLRSCGKEYRGTARIRSRKELVILPQRNNSWVCVYVLGTYLSHIIAGKRESVSGAHDSTKSTYRDIFQNLHYLFSRGGGGRCLVTEKCHHRNVKYLVSSLAGVKK